MKKTKIITLSLLGILLLVPFIRPSKAHGVSPYNVGIEEGDHEEFDFSIYVGGSFETWDPWFDDNMSNFWAEPFGQTTLDNMTSTWELAGKVPIAPQVNCFFDVESVDIDTGGFDANFDEVVSADETWSSPGRTMVTMATTSGSFMDFPGWPYYRYFENGTTVFISDTAAGFAEDVGYGVLATSAMWATNLWNFAQYGIYNTNTLFFAPNNTDWSDFAAECNTGLETTYALAANYTYDLTVYDLSNGFKLSSPVMGFGNNSETINITTTYDANGLMTNHTFVYGSTLLYEIGWVESDAPVVIDAPSDFNVDVGYTGVTLSWTATDANPNQYGITRDGTGVVVPTSWTNGTEIQYAVPDGLAAGNYVFQIGYTDDRMKVTYDQVTMSVLPPPPVPPAIPGYEPLLVLGFFTAATIGIIILKKRKK